MDTIEPSHQITTTSATGKVGAGATSGAGAGLGSATGTGLGRKRNDDRSGARHSRHEARRLSPRQIVRGALWASGAVLLILVIIAIFSEPLKEAMIATLETIRRLGPWAPIAFVFLYAALSLIAVPTTPLDIGAGLLFHLGLGFGVSLAGSMLGAVSGFLLARYLLREPVRRRLERYASMRAMIATVNEEPFKVIFFARINPAIPATLKNYCFGVTHVSLGKYVSASLLGMAPAVLIHVYFGSLGHLTLRGGYQEMGAMKIAVLALGLVASVTLGAILVVYGRRKHQQSAATT